MTHRLTSQRTGSATQLHLLLLFAAGLLTTSCERADPETGIGAEPSCDTAAVREVVERLGERMKQVSIGAADSMVEREIRSAYQALVTPALLDSWIADPARAPGREVSSPWPERIALRSVAAASDTSCVVEGEAIYVTSVEMTGDGAAMRAPVTLRVVKNTSWLISAYETSTPASTDADATTVTQPAAVIRRYYAAINARDFEEAYQLWGDSGAASGQTLEEFVAGFAGTGRVEWQSEKRRGWSPRPARGSSRSPCSSARSR